MGACYGAVTAPPPVIGPEDADGSHLDFTGTLTEKRDGLGIWLLNANGANMAYLLSAQLATMELNLLHAFVDPDALIYAPGVPSGTNGFAAVSKVMADAEEQLTVHSITLESGRGSAFRPVQQAIEDALDKANRNLNFVQLDRCPSPASVN